jgi:hypothetical protein
MERLFTRLDDAITGAGYLPMAGQIVDATLVSAPRQRNPALIDRLEVVAGRMLRA